MTISAAQLRAWDRAIAALMCCRTIKEAAEQSRVCERSIMRWQKMPEFQAQYHLAKREKLDASVNRLRTAGFDAAQRLHKIVLDPEAPIASVVSAAGRILDLLLKATEIQDLSERLDRLEESVRESEQ